MEIIEYQEQYKMQVAEVITKIQQEEFQIAITLEDQPDLMEIQDFYIAGGGNFWLALDGDQVVGTIALIRLENKNLALRKMFVKKEYRRHKVGQLLLDTAIEFAQAKGYKAIYLGTITTFEAAIAFYKKNGFEALAITDFPADFPLVAVDNVFLKKRL